MKNLFERRSGTHGVWMLTLAVAMSSFKPRDVAGSETTITEAAEWNQFLGPNRNGMSAETGLLNEWPADGPKLSGEFQVALECPGSQCQETLLLRSYSMTGHSG